MTPEAFATDPEIVQNNLLDGFEFLSMRPNDWLSCTLFRKSLSNDYIRESKQVISSNKLLTNDIVASIDCSTRPAGENNNESSYNSPISSMCNSSGASPNSQTAATLLPHSQSSEPSLTNKWGKMPVDQTRPWKLLSSQSSVSRYNAAIVKTTMMSSFGANMLLKKQIRLQFRDFNTAKQSLDELDRIEMNINGAALWYRQIASGLNSDDSYLESCKNKTANSDKSLPILPHLNNPQTDQNILAKTEQDDRKSGELICLNAKLPAYINNRGGGGGGYGGTYGNSNCNFHAKKLSAITIHSTSSVIRDNDHPNIKHHKAFAGLFYGKNPFKFLANNFLCENLLAMNVHQSNKTAGLQPNSDIDAKSELLINSKLLNYDI